MSAFKSTSYKISAEIYGIQIEGEPWGAHYDHAAQRWFIDHIATGANAGPPVRLESEEDARKVLERLRSVRVAHNIKDCSDIETLRDNWAIHFAGAMAGVNLIPEPILARIHLVVDADARWGAIGGGGGDLPGAPQAEEHVEALIAELQLDPLTTTRFVVDVEIPRPIRYPPTPVKGNLGGSQ